MRTVYVNGDYVPESQATVSVFDRGFLFADAVYEVVTVFEGKLIDFAGHMLRLRRSLSELKMQSPASDEDLLEIHRQLVKANGLVNGLIYLQVTRGAADRDFLFPGSDVKPGLVLFTQAKELVETSAVKTGLKVITLDDLRWRRCDIKTVQLLYASMVKNIAHDQGADDAWLVLDGYVTEGSSNNAYIVSDAGKIITRSLGNEILSGITRKAVLACAADLGIEVEERAFSVDEAYAAREAFATSATGFVNPVTFIDGKKIGDGQPGPVGNRLRERYIELARENAI